MAGRREKLRRVGIIPEYRGFTPDGLASGDAIDMTVDELEALGEYNDGDDYGLYVNAKREAWVEMHEGDLVVTPPCDAHKPGCCTEAGPAKLKKACVKVLVD